ncbi:hypothetical protein GCM10020369_33340 [Cryptosporangium minutisporangium]|uniref:Uncharacterized protein n=1 Tax=Cryptosporangium minutisporangium TaxID=113569 RepID=A0ABP6SXT5_9ACTN
MVLVRRSAAALVEDADSGKLSKILAEQATHQLRAGVGAAPASVPALAAVIVGSRTPGER